MKRGILFLTSLSLCLVLGTLPAHAQFWKDIFRKERAPVRKPAPKPGPAAKPLRPNAPSKPTTSLKKAEAKKKAAESSDLEPTVFKDRYRIDVLAPVYLHELVAGGKAVYKSHLPDKVLPGLGFYQGIKMAADTLDTYGYQMDVYFHDIADPLHSVDGLIKQHQLDSSDLIVGAVPAQNVPALAAFAKKLHVNFVSVLSPSDGNVHDNLYFNLLQPRLDRHCEVLSRAVARKSRAANILVYRRSNVPLDEQSFKAITVDSAFAYTRVMMNTPMPSEKLRNFLDSNMENVIVMPIVDVSYARQLLDQLSRSFPKHHFEVYGMPSWKGMSQLRKEGSLPNIGITITAPFYFDPSTSIGRDFSENFSKTYGGRPSEMAFRGYETLYWYAYLLNRYGTIFNSHYGDNGAAPFTRFDMRTSLAEDGLPDYYENYHLYLYRYQGGSFSVEQ